MLSRRYAETRGLIIRRRYEQLWENHIQPSFAQDPFMRGWFQMLNEIGEHFA